MPAFERLTSVFYDLVSRDEVVGPVFRDMSLEHPLDVARFIAEVLGGPKAYSEQHGSHREMIRHHVGRSLTEPQRRTWVALLQDAADAAGLPGDPEFRSAFLGYLEWGSRLAVINSQPGVELGDPGPMPAWGWGEVGGPYVAG